MNWYRLRSAVVAATLLVACKEDPTASLAGDPASVTLAFSRLEVDVDASAIVDAVVRDGSGTPLSVPVAVTSTDQTVATASAAQDPPHVLTRVTVQAAKVGTAKIIATAAGLADTMDVATFAARLVVTDLGPVVGTMVSGQSKSFGFKYESASGRDLTAQVAPPTWSVDEPTRATVNTATGDITGKDFGAVTVTAKGPGAPEGGITGSATVFVQPAAFQGTVSPDPATNAQVVTIARGTGPAFNSSDTKVFFNRSVLDTQRVALDTMSYAPNRVASVTPDQITVILGDTSAGNVEVVLTGVGASQLSVGTGPADSLTIAPAAVAVSPSPIDPGNTLIITAGAGMAFNPATTRVYLDGVIINDLADVVASVTAGQIDLEVSDVRSASTVKLLLSRLTGGGGAASSFVVRAPTAFTGTLSANGGTPAQVVTITRAAGGPPFDPPDTRVFFNGIETFIAQGGTADAINVAVPVIDQLGQVELRMTRLGTAQQAQAITFTSTTKSFNDPFDAVNNDPSTAPAITADGDYFVVLHGGCVNGAGGGGADCDDWFTITNTSGSPATVSLEVFWEDSDADIDLIPLDENFDCADQPVVPTPGFQCRTTATLDDPETGTVIIPANTTYFILLNYFTFNGQHHLTRLRVSGLP